MKFFIQTIKGKITFDFALELVNAIESHNYFYPNDKIEYILDDNYKDYAWENKFQEWCPIGSVEFVCGWLKHFYGESMIPKPINVPNALRDQYFTRRFIDEETINDEFRKKTNSFVSKIFAKDVNKIKSENNGLYELGYRNIPDGTYQVSSYIKEIKAEFRCFIFENKLLDVRLYNGDYKILPDFDKIQKMIDTYMVDAPVAYTLDVAVNEDDDTIVIEVHDFFSCGLYGFMETKRLPYMFWRWYYNHINKINYSKLKSGL